MKESKRPTQQMGHSRDRGIRRLIWRIVRDNPGLTYRQLTPLFRDAGGRLRPGADVLVYLKILRSLQEVRCEWIDNWDSATWYAVLAEDRQKM